VNFFEHQDQARRSTSRLVALFCLAVALLIGGLYLAVVAIVALYVTKSELADIVWWKPELFLLVSLGSVLLIGAASAYRMYSLRSGGAALAESLGGRPAEAHSDDPATRRLLNVVEEMALASGTPVPRVFVLDREEGINAFAAGHDLGDAVIAVTGGALRKLDREELQGVVAHELSHVVNGDMRLNLRLIGVLHGILLLGSIGAQLLRATARGGRSRSSKGSSAVAILFSFGLALVVIGYTGVLVGRLIKSAVSRQREFLADASAVQFTRNPRGLSGALQKIRDSVDGSRVAIAGAERRRATCSSPIFSARAGGRASWPRTLPCLSGSPGSSLPQWLARRPP
jgi:Zn-dependent protease with chaperone function